MYAVVASSRSRKARDNPPHRYTRLEVGVPKGSLPEVPLTLEVVLASLTLTLNMVADQLTSNDAQAAVYWDCTRPRMGVSTSPGNSTNQHR